MKNKIIHGLILLFLPVSFTLAQNNTVSREIIWNDIQTFRISENEEIKILTFDGASQYDRTGTLPVYSEKIRLDNPAFTGNVKITGMMFESIDGISEIYGDDIESVTSDIKVNTSLTYDNKEPYLVFSFVPIIKNPLIDIYEKLIKFQYTVVQDPVAEPSMMHHSRSWATTSVLSSGKWYRIAVNNSGIYRIDRNMLSEMGIDPALVDPRDIRIYGNGGGMLPEKNNDFRYDDLVENAIMVSGEDDGSFDLNDYILFYGESPHTWKYNAFKTLFEHTSHLYSDDTYYFLTTDLGRGKRIEAVENTQEEPTDIVTTFNDYRFHEKDELNLIKSGRRWFGEIFDALTTYNFPFDFPNPDPEAPVHITSNVAARSTISSSFTMTVEGESTSVGITAISTSYNSQFAREGTMNKVILPQRDKIEVQLKYNKPTTSSLGWLNYIEVNARRFLRFSGDQMPFRDALSGGAGKVAEFRMEGAASSVTIWDVTNPTNIKKVNATPNGNNLVFRLKSDTLREFIAWNGSTFFTPRFIEVVANQNLHGLSVPDYMIISHPLFLEEAGRLAQYHETVNGLSAILVTPQQIYNEFSSGAPDISAIRDFVKMFYDRAGSGDEPRYLLLFGDGSYDNKNRLENNTNFILTFQSSESFHPVVSYVSDDYYGFLDDGEGTGENDAVDIGIGRLPVATVEEARFAVDKIIHYSTPSMQVMNDWRNVICFIADDEDSNIHLVQAENLATYIDTAHKVYNINKIYLDSYIQVSTPGGQRYPDVNQAINDQVEKGALIVNYTGHGGEVGWAHERILELADINGWSNFDQMPLFVTATCEFSRFDDPGRTSAGEYVFLNPDGGGIALLTTARATFGSPNYNLNKSIYTYAFNKIDDQYPALGDIFKLSKRKSGSDNNGRKFVLLGDPAQKLAYANYNVVTTSVNFNDVTSQPDTIRALSEVTISGNIQDNMGNVMNNYSGIIHTTVFDKPLTITTQSNDGGTVKTFQIQKSILHKGQTSIKEGQFDITFIVPKDIAYHYGYGKISYYAKDGLTDASGYYEKIVIGGFNENMEPDVTGPYIELFMNDEYFREGGITDPNPVLLAKLADENGINTVGNGIGHDIIAVIDQNSDDPRVLNEYYESDLNTYKSGSVHYPLFNLSEGIHRIKVKVWDVYNNSSEAFISFVVTTKDDFSLEHIMNYPNPFIDQTWFTFEHNQAGQELQVEIQIFSLNGQLVKTIQTSTSASGYRMEPVPWDGRDAHGNKLRSGMYVFRTMVTNSYGDVKEGSSKLVIFKQYSDN